MTQHTSLFPADFFGPDSTRIKPVYVNCLPVSEQLLLYRSHVDNIREHIELTCGPKGLGGDARRIQVYKIHECLQLEAVHEYIEVLKTSPDENIDVVAAAVQKILRERFKPWCRELDLTVISAQDHSTVDPGLALNFRAFGIAVTMISAYCKQVAVETKGVSNDQNTE